MIACRISPQGFLVVVQQLYSYRISVVNMATIMNRLLVDYSIDDLHDDVLLRQKKTEWRVCWPIFHTSMQLSL